MNPIKLRNELKLRSARGLRDWIERAERDRADALARGEEERAAIYDQIALAAINERMRRSNTMRRRGR